MRCRRSPCISRSGARPMRDSAGKLVEYTLRDVSPDMSFLEMLDVLNEELIRRGEDPIAFDYDCREGICGSCGVVINGVPHGPQPATTTCQLFMRHFTDGDTIVVEPWRAQRFPGRQGSGRRPQRLRPHHRGRRLRLGRRRQRARSQRDPDRQGRRRPRHGRGRLHRLRRLRRRVQERLGGAVRRRQDRASRCCCRRARLERERRVARMVEQMEHEGFGACSNEGECQAVCPKEISDRPHPGPQPRVRARGAEGVLTAGASEGAAPARRGRYPSRRADRHAGGRSDEERR